MPDAAAPHGAAAGGNTATARTLARHPKPLGGDPLRKLRPTVSLSGMILNNREPVAHLQQKRKPEWLKARVPGGAAFRDLKSNIDRHKLHTVCQEAGCPNMGECWSRGVATIMILGDTCTRSCGFCNVKSGIPIEVDRDEPRRAAESIRLMNLKHVVVTSVNRDELRDGGASIWADLIYRVRESSPNTSIEVLIPDFMGRWDALQMVIDARPHIIAHNVETVKRMYPAVRPSARYERSMDLLRRLKEQGVVAKTSIMVGIGERESEVHAFMDDLVAMTSDHGGARDPSDPSRGDPCDILTIGQYLQPTVNHLPIHRWVHPDEFARYEAEGLRRGLKVVQSGPLVRSSYLADAQADKLTDIQQTRRADAAAAAAAGDTEKLARVNALIGR